MWNRIFFGYKKKIFFYFKKMCFTQYSALVSYPSRNYMVQDFEEINIQDKIVFFGSSSIRLWKNVNSYFSTREILNFGIGGGTWADALFYTPRLFCGKNASIILTMFGGNDLMGYIGNESTRLHILEYHLKEFLHCIQKCTPSTSIILQDFAKTPQNYYRNEDHKKISEIHHKLSDTFPNIYVSDICNFTSNLPSSMFEKMYDSDDRMHLNSYGYEIISPYIENHIDHILKTDATYKFDHLLYIIPICLICLFTKKLFFS